MAAAPGRNLFSQSGDNSSGAQVFSQKVISLARYQGQSIKVRFLYHFAEALLGNGFYPQTTLNAGWFVDDITVSNVSVGAPVATVPVITQQPAAQTTVLEGAAVTWSVTATGTAPLSYQWQKDGVAIPGATTNTLNLPQVALAAAGTYTLLISNSAGSLPSNPAALTVTARAVAPAVARQPTSQNTPRRRYCNALRRCNRYCAHYLSVV